MPSTTEDTHTDPRRSSRQRRHPAHLKDFVIQLKTERQKEVITP